MNFHKILRFAMFLNVILTQKFKTGNFSNRLLRQLFLGPITRIFGNFRLNLQNNASIQPSNFSENREFLDHFLKFSRLFMVSVFFKKIPAKSIKLMFFSDPTFRPRFSRFSFFREIWIFRFCRFLELGANRGFFIISADF